MRVLIAEDETIIRLDLRGLLEGAGHEVCAEARDGVEAVELARSEDPDVALLDVKMPRLDGIEAAKQILEERFPSSKSGRRPKIYYATQVGTAPPTIVLFVNNPEFFDESYQRFMINRFRELLPYAEVPIKLQIRGKGEQEQQRAKAKTIDEQVHPARTPRRAPRANAKARQNRSRKR